MDFTTGSTISETFDILDTYATGSEGIILRIVNGVVQIAGSNGITNTSYTVASSTKYLVKLVYNGTDTLDTYFSNNNGSTFTLILTKTITAFADNQPVYLGGRRSSTNFSNPFNGSIDLKQFSITVDGVPVFTGNKTGVDKYPNILDGVTKAGSPTITNGVLSNITSSNYIRSTNTLKFKTANTWKIKCKFNYTANSTYEQGLFSGDGGTNIQVIINTSGITRCAIGNNSSWFITTNNTLSTALVDGNTYTYELGYDGTNYYAALNGTTEVSVASASKAGNTYIALGVDRLRTTNQQLRGSIDLADFEVIIDDVLVWSPVLAIPYSLSKTGSKVVNSIYRTKVTSVYNEQGYAPYYTLSDSNFTLPMGEVYGLIEQKIDNSTPHLVKKYENGTSWYRIYSDGWCEQGDFASATGNIALLKNYKDTNYSVLLGDASMGGTSVKVYTSNKTTSSFDLRYDQWSAPSTTSCYWETKGYIS